MHRRLLWASLGALLATPASGTTWLVTPDGTGDFPTIQSAIDAAQPGDVIELAAGTFTGDGNRAISFRGKAITVRSQSGNPQLCTIDCESAARGFLFTNGESEGSVLDGVTITNGRANEGGAILCNDTSPRIARCVFFRNRGNWIAGAIMCVHASPMITNCRIAENTSDIFGGAVVGSDGCDPTFTDCVFLADSVGQGGGAVCFDLMTRGSFIRCRFERNASGWTGGGVMSWCATLELTDCVFLDNTAVGFGGGLYDGGVNSGGTLTGCTFANNRADIYGGGVYHEGSELTVTHCTFHGNASPTGGGFFCFNVWPDPVVTIASSIFTFSTEGMGVHAWDEPSVPTLTCCDIYGNAGGDWVGYIASQAGVNGNLAVDPLFCDAAHDDYRLSMVSPCATHVELSYCGGGVLGAWGVGCGSGARPARGDRAGGGFGPPASLAAWPNPFVGECRFAIPLAAPGEVTVGIFEPTGRLVRTLAARGSSVKLARWDGRDDDGRELPGGAYLMRVETPEGMQTLQILRLR